MRISSKSSSPSEAFADENAVEAADEPTLKTSPDEIDARRAHQLLERAASLAARGDMGAAVLATRQSLALAPTGVEGHLLLARLLERNRDFGGARAAYEKSVQLAPERADARDNLARLDAYLQQSQGAARQFQFDAEELFAPAADNFAAESDEISAPVAVAPAESPSMEMFDETMLPSLEARLPPTREETEAAIGAETSDETRVEIPATLVTQNVNREGDRRKNNVPVATERRRSPAAVVPIPLAPVSVASAPVVVAVAPTAAAASGIARPSDNIFNLDEGISAGTAPRSALDLDLPAASTTPVWQQVIARPSFYARTLPVVGVALLSLGFLSWARGRAVSQVVAPAPTQLAQAELPAPDAPAQTTTAPGAGAPASNNAANSGATPNTDAGGFPISNAPVTFQAPPASGNAATSPANGNASAGGNAPSTTARASNRSASGGSSTTRAPRRVLPPARPVPNFPSVSLAPAPIPPASVRSTIPRANANQNSGDNSIILPRPSVDLSSAPEPRQRVLPPSDSGLNPAGAPGRGYVRITEGRVGNGVIPSQPGGVARQNESSANAAARNGQTDQAISQLSQAIRADSDNAGFRYQQRATLFLQRGDYNRASDDFQSAISAYQAQINNGDDVAQAKRGLNSARSGLTLALAGKRG